MAASTIHEPPPETPFVASPTRGDRAASEGHYREPAEVVNRRKVFVHGEITRNDLTGLVGNNPRRMRGIRPCWTGNDSKSARRYRARRGVR
jgi:hypothetical protein